LVQASGRSAQRNLPGRSPLKLEIFKNCKKIIAIGSYASTNISGRITVIDISKSEIMGFLDFKHSIRIKKLVRGLSIEDISNELEEIYALYASRNKRDEIETWYPLVSKNMPISNKNFILVKENVLQEVNSK